MPLGLPKPPKLLYFLRILIFMGRLRLTIPQAMMLLMLLLISMYQVLLLLSPNIASAGASVSATADT